MTESPRRIFLVDGNALAYRSYFAFIRNPLINSKGRNTSAVYGFTMAIRRIVDSESPDAVLVVFDPPGPTFRHERYESYKATREKMPDEMRDQMPDVRAVVDAMGIPIIEKEGYEADDVIGTLAARAAANGDEAFLVSGDKDFMQLVGDGITIFDPGRSGSGVSMLGPAEVEEKFGVAPGLVVDVLALMGDSSDNVPGIPGIGEKTAKKLVGEHGSLDEIYEHLEDVTPPRIRKKLEEHRDLAELSRDLVTIERDVPLADDEVDFRPPRPDESRLVALYRELEFKSLVASKEESIESVAHRYHTVTDVDDIDRLGERLAAAKVFSVDLETTSVEPMKAKIVGLSFAIEEHEAFYVPADTGDDMFQRGDRGAQWVVERLRGPLENEAIRKIGQNIQYDALVLRRYGVELRGMAFDTMIAAYCVEPGSRQYDLDGLALQYLGYRKIPMESLVGKGAKRKSMAEVPVEDVSRYACEDADVTLRLRERLAVRMRERAVEELFETIEMPLVPVLIEMEERGVSIDKSMLEAMSKRLATSIAELEKEVHRLAGEEFNIGSPKQLGTVLFEKLAIHEELGAKRLRKTKTGYATDQQTLEKYAAHPIVDTILEYRQLTKLKSTYVDALPALIHPDTGRVHTSFNQTIAATGRLSSSNPNLQNIPIRTEIGREIRKAFVPGDPDRLFLGADYSQIELRILAHLSGDEGLVAAFREGLDIHTQTASKIFEVDPDAITIEMRSKAKAINFGVLYGMGPDRLAAEVKITRKEAQEFIETYFERFASVRALIDRTIEDARRNGYVTTILGRRRYINDIRSGDNRARRAAENMAVNTPVQGSAADLIKKAMIDVHRTIRERELESAMILQVHDELLFEVPRSEEEELGILVREAMEGTLELDVPLVVEIHTGTSWYEAH